MDLDDGEGFPVETAKEKILTVSVTPELRHWHSPTINDCPGTDFTNVPGANALHSPEDELVGDDDH